MPTLTMIRFECWGDSGPGRGPWAGRWMDAKISSATFTSREPPRLLQLLRRGTEGIRPWRPVWWGRWLGKQRSVIERTWPWDSKHLSSNPRSHHILALHCLGLSFLIYKMGILASSSQGCCENRVSYGCTMCGPGWAPSKWSCCCSGDLVDLNLCWRQSMLSKQREVWPLSKGCHSWGDTGLAWFLS